MKKIILSIVACGFLLASCSESEPVTPEKNGTVKFKVTAVNSIKTRGDILTTGNDGPIPTFTVVNVYAFLKNESDQYLYTQTIDLLSDYTGDPTYSAVRVLADNTFSAGEYKFLAVGRMASDGYTLTTPDADTNFDDFSASITAPGPTTNVIFAGNKTQEVLESGASIEIEISRQVAGIFTYLSDVPTKIDGTDVAYLRLRVTKANNSVNLTTGEGAEPATLTNGSYYAIEIHLAGQNIDEANNVYAGPGDSDGLDIVDNSQIESNYAIPTGDVTMTLELQDASSNTLKTWAVQDGDGTPASIDLTANVLLAIGVKNKAGGIFGDDDAESGTGENADDTPVSLLTDETITVNVMRNWETVQNLTLVEQ